jgi:hypothetical protein
MKKSDPVNFHDRIFTEWFFARSPLYLVAGLGMSAGGIFLLWEALWHPQTNYMDFGDHRFFQIACPVLLIALGSSIVVIAVNTLRKAVRVPPPPHK